MGQTVKYQVGLINKLGEPLNIEVNCDDKLTQQQANLILDVFKNTKEQWNESGDDKIIKARGLV